MINTPLGQPMFNIFDRLNKYNDSIHFEIGDTCVELNDNLELSLLSGGKKNYHYCSAKGLDLFIQEIISFYKIKFNFDLKEKNILITPGVNIIPHLIMNSCNIKTVAFNKPYFPSYYNISKLNGKHIITENIEYDIRFIDLIIVNSPNNPDGKVINDDDIKNYYQISKRTGTYIYYDEIYRDLIYKGKYVFPLKFDPDITNTIIGYGFSKAFGMAGLRLGYMIAPEDIIHNSMKWIETTLSCVSPFVQNVGIEALRNIHIAENNKKMFKEKMNLMISVLKKNKKIHIKKPDGGIYLFLQIDDLDIFKIDKIIERTHVGFCKGSYFGKDDNYIRLNFAVKDEDIFEGCNRLINEF